MRRTTVAAVLMPSALALTLTACGSSAQPTGAAAAVSTPTATPNTHLTSAQINAGAKAATAKATALKLDGTMQDTDGPITMDVQVNANSGGGTLGKGGVTIPIRLVDGVPYMQMTPNVLKGLVDKQVPSSEQKMVDQLLMNKWVDSKSGGKDMASFTQFLTLKTLVSHIFGGDDGTYTYSGTGTVDGQQVAQYRDVSSNGDFNGTVSIPLYGPILPVKLDNGTKGSITFVWNKPVPVTAPPSGDIVTMPNA